MKKEIEVRRVIGKDDFSAIEDLQKRTWGIDDLTTVPAHVLQAACKYNAGFVAAAFHDNKVIGLIFSLETKDRNVHHMHMIGVDPDWQSGRQGKSIGAMLCKFYQKHALKQGIKVIEWTFDPLLTNNAKLYFNKLRAKIAHYEPDAYGKTSEVGIYRGMPTDRVLVRWYLKDATRNSVNACDIGKISLVSVPSEIDGQSFKMEVPFDIQALKLEKMELAYAARMQSRKIFLAALKKGYNIKDFIHLKKEHKNYYVFSKKRNDR